MRYPEAIHDDGEGILYIVKNTKFHYRFSSSTDILYFTNFANSFTVKTTGNFICRKPMNMDDLKFSEKTKFSVICNVFEKIEKQKNKDQKVEIMKQFIASFRQQSKNQQVRKFWTWTDSTDQNSYLRILLG